MYLQFYQLDRAPFKPSADLDVLWAGKNYQKSLEALKYGLTHHSGLSLLTGNPGSGKTTVIHAVLRSLEQTVLAAVIPDSSLTVQEFYDLVSHSLALPGQIDNRATFHEHIRALLQQAGEQRKLVLLVVDEAQQLSTELIEEIDALVNLHPQESGGLNICLIGQVGNTSGLGGRVIKAFENHVMVRYHLGPFTADETKGYIRLRLQVAGAKREIFNEEAIQAVHRYSGGYPGQINIICDLALFSGFVEKSPEITASIIHASAEKMQFPTASGKGDTVKREATAKPIGSSSRPKASKEKDKRSPGKRSWAMSAKKKMVLPKPVIDIKALRVKTTGRSFAVPSLAVLMVLLLAGGGYVYVTKRDNDVPAGGPFLPVSAVQSNVDGQTARLEPAPEKEPINNGAVGSIAAEQNRTVHEQPLTPQAVPDEKTMLKPGTVAIKEEKINNNEPENIPSIPGTGRREQTVAGQPVVNEKPELAGRPAPGKLQKTESTGLDSFAEAALKEEKAPVAEPSVTVMVPAADQVKKPVAGIMAANDKQPTADSSVPVNQRKEKLQVVLGSESFVESQGFGSENILEKPGGQDAAPDEQLVAKPSTAAIEEESVNKRPTENIISIPPTGGKQDGILVVDQPVINEEQETAEHPTATTLQQAIDPILKPVSEAGPEKEEDVVDEPPVIDTVPTSAGREKVPVAEAMTADIEQKTVDTPVAMKQKNDKLQEFLGQGSFVESAVSASEKILESKAPAQVPGPSSRQGKISIRREIDSAPDPSSAIDWVLKKRNQQDLNAQ